MQESVFDSSWYRVASVIPKLRSHAAFHRHQYRKKIWYVMQEQTSNRFHRFTPEAYFVLVQMNGERSVQEIWDMACTELGDDAPTQGEIIRLLSTLYTTDVLQCDISPDIDEILKRHNKHESNKWKQNFKSPLMIKLPLYDPDKFLTRHQNWVRICFTRKALFIWFLVMLMSTIIAVYQWQELTQNISDNILAPNNLVIMLLIFPLLKAIHELGHAFAVKVWGGEVHEIGIMLLMLMPIPYVDASASSSFEDKKKRMIVSAAGMGVELFIAAIALFIWVNVEPGLVRAICYNVIILASVSTILFNANPLLRYDGYYILADLIEIPNLYSRSYKYLGYVIQKYLFGIKSSVSPAEDTAEKKWFIFYSIASFFYKIALYVMIIMFVVTKFFIIGVILAIWASVSMFFVPIFKKINYLLTDNMVQRKRQRVLTTLSITVAILSSVIFILPFPHSTNADGVMWVRDAAIVRVETNCFVTELIITPDSAVKEGDELLRCEDPFLESREKILRYKVEELHAQYLAELVNQKVRAKITLEELKQLQANHQQVLNEKNKLIIVSKTAGNFIVPSESDLIGNYFQKGKVIAYVYDKSSVRVRVAIPQSTVDLVRSETKKIEARLLGSDKSVLRATISREAPEATYTLPSMVLGSAGGGNIMLNPRDDTGTTAYNKYFQFELNILTDANVINIGSRLLIKFDHGYKPIGLQWFRAIKQLFLGKLDG